MTMSARAATCHQQALADARNLLATGNLVVQSDLATPDVEARFTAALATGGLHVARQRRSGALVLATIAAVRALPQLADALVERPSKVQVHCVPAAVSDAALGQLRLHDAATMIACAGDAVIIDDGPMILESPLTQARIDKTLGRENTARNCNTMRKIAGPL
jgi:uncharacterized protein (DUF1697 family)